MSKENIDIWCVGMCFGSGKHKICVFDNLENAEDFFDRVHNNGKFKGHCVNKIVMWEM